MKLEDRSLWLPLDNCTNRCNERGWCVQPRRGPVACRCHGFWKGPTCEWADNWHCFRNCSGVGVCKGGWCHCQPGYWGHGCTRTRAYASPKGWQPDHAQLKVYVYDVPTHIVHYVAPNDVYQVVDPLYMAELYFAEQLLGDWAVRTENPWEANLFFVPTYAYWYSGNIGSPLPIFLHIARWLQQAWPFWNETGGRNHFWFTTNDRGGCGVYGHPEVQHAIMLTHFGQAPRHPYPRQQQGGNSGSPPLAAGGSAGGASVPVAAHAVGLRNGTDTPSAKRFRGFPREFSQADLAEELAPCFRPEKDIVVPNTAHPVWTDWVRGEVWDTAVGPEGRVSVRRFTGNESWPHRYKFFFAGGNRPEMLYSQGVRQALFALFGPDGPYDPAGPNARSDFFVVPNRVDGKMEMMTSDLCLAVMGYGWGARLLEAMMAGCVPVIVEDHTYQPLWQVLPYEEFSLRISRADLHRIVDIIDAVTPQQLQRLKAGVDAWHRAFLWAPPAPLGLAYNYTLRALRMQLISLWSDNFRRRRRRRRQLLESTRPDISW